MTLGDRLAALNACLNSIAAILLFVGWRNIKAKRVAAHRACMLGALGVSALFLVSYLTRVVVSGTHRYPGTGVLKATYFTLLSTHMLLAIATPPLAIVAILFALRGRIELHRRVVKWTLPIWMYVSVTGVLVYLMLYQLPH